MKITLENQRACRLVLISPVFLPLIIAAVLSLILKQLEILGIGLIIEIFFAIFYLLHVSTYLSGIKIVNERAKQNFEVRKGKKIYKQYFYEKQYHMTLKEYICSMKDMLRGHTDELHETYEIMENDSFRMDEDAIYYKCNNRLLEVIYEADEADPCLLHIDKDTATWSFVQNYLNNDITLSKAESKEIFTKIESYLRNENYRFDYRIQ